MRPAVFIASALWLGLGHPLAASGQQPAAQPMDVVLVVDNSGSMRKNDPNSLMSRGRFRIREPAFPRDPAWNRGV